MQIRYAVLKRLRLCVGSRPSVKPYHRTEQGEEGPDSELQHGLLLCFVDPLLPLWQQSVVQQAALKAVAAAGASFHCSQRALSTLVGKIARKVRELYATRNSTGTWMLFLDSKTRAARGTAGLIPLMCVFLQPGIRTATVR